MITLTHRKNRLIAQSEHSDMLTALRWCIRWNLLGWETVKLEPLVCGSWIAVVTLEV